jgi:hypothetical protein
MAPASLQFDTPQSAIPLLERLRMGRVDEKIGLKRFQEREAPADAQRG